MIQRIQTLYLLLVAVLMAILCFVPFASFLHENEVFRQTVWGIAADGARGELIVKTIPMGILAVLSALLPLVVIFLYKKRGLQMRLCVVEMILLVGMIVYLAMYLFRSGSDISDKLVFSVTDLFPLLAIILTFMAFKRIMKDEMLVKSLDRIR
ncbi:MAG: DUF4293 domain-containing protein [Rikenellaceae bacterium]|jgi:ABC-type proline/glycine betaine transport system permease subunit|nr:DUF4293 domain-containing protein [Rikenellaceae bacterium]